MSCPCATPTCPGDGGRYYVTVVDAGRVGYLLGPYDTHVEALANVERARGLAEGVDPRAWFYAFGTARTSDAFTPATRFGLTEEPAQAEAPEVDATELAASISKAEARLARQRATLAKLQKSL